MKIDTYKQLKKLVAEELNIHEIRQVIAMTEKGSLSVCFWTSLGFSDKPDELYLRLGEERLDKSTLLEKIVTEI